MPSRVSPSALRVSAYVLVADPSFLKQSVMAYYPYVDRIVLSYDRTATSWTGTPLPIAQCLEILEQVDHDRKCVHVPGDFARTDRDPLINDTAQRQAALDAASAGADWVLQLDTDEVMLEPGVFFESLRRADEAEASGLDFPALWLYARTSEGRYLQHSTRFWRNAASYPGPLAVRARTRLRLARQADVPLYRVDLRPHNTDPWHPRNATVDRIVSPGAAVAHFSWVRDDDAMRRKFHWSGHTEQMVPPQVYRRWAWRSRHPLMTVASTPLRRRDAGWYRLARIPEPPGGEPPAVRLVDGHTRTERP